jgi:hypothetical protein
MKKRGTRQEVWDHMAQMTSGGLTRNDLMLNKKGVIVSKKKSQMGGSFFSPIGGAFKNIGH